MKKGYDKRIKLLSHGEITDLYGLPLFSEHERTHYFLLSPAENEVMNQLSLCHIKVHFILQLGYFKAKKRLFSFNLQEVSHDVAYVIHTYFSHCHSLNNYHRAMSLLKIIKK